MTEAELVQIEQRAAAATAGPWVLSSRAGDRDERVRLRLDTPHAPDDDRETLLMERRDYYPTVPRQDEDWTFIAHAREDVPALVAEVRRLRGLIASAEWLGPVIDQRASCPWCLMRQPRGHAANCPGVPVGGVMTRDERAAAQREAERLVGEGESPEVAHLIAFEAARDLAGIRLARVWPCGHSKRAGSRCPVCRAEGG